MNILACKRGLRYFLLCVRSAIIFLRQDQLELGVQQHPILTVQERADIDISISSIQLDGGNDQINSFVFQLLRFECRCGTMDIQIRVSLVQILGKQSGAPDAGRAYDND